MNHQPRRGKASERGTSQEEAQRNREKRHQRNEFPPTPKTSTKSTTHAFLPSRALLVAARLALPLLAVWSPRGRRAGPDPAPWRRASAGGSRIRSSPPPSACRTPPTGTGSPCFPALICCLAPEPRVRSRNLVRLVAISGNSLPGSGRDSSFLLLVYNCLRIIVLDR